MATESDGEEDTAGRLTGCQHLDVDDDLREMAKKAAWSVSSCKPGNGVLALRDDNLDTYWQLIHPSPFFFSLPSKVSPLPPFPKDLSLKIVETLGNGTRKECFCC